MTESKRKASKLVFKDYGIAAYPISWKQYVISPQKICLQFQDLQLKARAPHSKEGLTRSHWGTHLLPIDTQGTDVNVLAVGIPLRLYPQLLKNILKAINEHSKLYPEYSIKSDIQEIIDGQSSPNL